MCADTISCAAIFTAAASLMQYVPRCCVTHSLQDPTIPHVPFEEKLHAIAYVNSNCGAQSGRSDIMRALMALGDKGKVRGAIGCDGRMQLTSW